MLTAQAEAYYLTGRALMTPLYQIQDDVRLRTEAIAAVHGNWPCRKGCDDCCRHLAAAPRVTREEWRLVADAIGALSPDAADTVRQCIRDSAGATRPVICPLLDRSSGTCLVYEARPVACRAYGFYAERRDVVGCSRIEWVARESADIVWGNHAALEHRLQQLGSSAELSMWLKSEESRDERLTPSGPGLAGAQREPG